MVKVLISAVLLFLSISLHATTWAPTEVKDPINGATVTGHEIMSYGSYVFESDAKYDLVSWPWTDYHFLWFSPTSGYIAFTPDFKTLKPEKKDMLAQWLKENYDPKNPPKDFLEKLLWAEKVYRARGIEADIWCQLYRIVAYTSHPDPVSKTYVQKALPLLEKTLGDAQTNLAALTVAEAAPKAKGEEKVAEKAKPSGKEHLEVIATSYILGEYYRRLEQTEKARTLLEKISTMEYLQEDGTLAKGQPYYSELAAHSLAVIAHPKKRPGAEPEPAHEHED